MWLGWLKWFPPTLQKPLLRHRDDYLPMLIIYQWPENMGILKSRWQPLDTWLARWNMKYTVGPFFIVYICFRSWIGAHYFPIIFDLILSCWCWPFFQRLLTHRIMGRLFHTKNLKIGPVVPPFSGHMWSVPDFRKKFWCSSGNHLNMRRTVFLK